MKYSWKGHKDRNRHKKRIETGGQAGLVYVKSINRNVPLVCVACNVVLTVKPLLIECADLLEIRKKYFEEKSLYSLVRNVIPEVVFDFLREIGVFYKV